MKDIESRLLSELLRNGRRSDRELAKTIGVSQPTVTRTRKKLEKEGYIKEYSIIPDWAKIGYEILALTFVNTKKGFMPEVVEKAKKIAGEIFQSGPFDIVMMERGTGLGFDAVVLSYHTSYSSYLDLVRWIKQFDFIELQSLESFLINLKDEVH